MAYTTIDDPTEYFGTTLYTGNETARAITFDGNSDLDVDWIWLKSRSATGNHHVYDTVRGTQKHLRTNLTNVEGTNGGTDGVTAFNSNGFTVGANTGSNADGVTFVGWGWKAGTSFTNDASSTGIGSLDSSGTVNDTAGFAIVKYTGNGTSGATIKHGLSTAPTFMMIRVYDAAAGFQIYSKSLGATKFVYLNTTEAAGTSAGAWNDTAPTSSIFTVGNGGNTNNTENAGLHIAYIFSERQGYSKFGSYTGNNNTDGTFVYTGFRPAWIMIKRSGTENTATNMNGSHWVMLDNKRDPINAGGAAHALTANRSAAEDTSNLTKVDFLSNGFKFRGGADAVNAADTYIYMAFAENPFVTSTGVPTTAR